MSEEIRSQGTGDPTGEEPSEKVGVSPADVRLFIATPAFGGMLTTGYFRSVLAAKSRLESQGATVVVDTISNESLILRARNGLVARFMAARVDGSPFTHLMFIDADVAFPTDAIERLLMFDKPITAGCYPLKAVDYAQIQRVLTEERGQSLSPEELEAVSLHYPLNCAVPEVVRDGFIPVFDVGSGFMCIQRRAIETLIEHFGAECRYSNNVPGYEVAGPDFDFDGELCFYALFDTLIDPRTGLLLSEDFTFCRRWQQTGGTIWLDLSTDLCHIGYHMYRGSIRSYLERLYLLPAEPE